MITSLWRIAFLALVLFSAACTKLTIEAPEDGTVSLSKPSTFIVNFVSGIPPNLQLVLNSTDVTDLFTITESGAVADGSLLADKVFSGKNQFSAVLGDFRIISSVFHFDDIGPTVHILSADHTAGTISGYVQDPSGVVSLSIDGNNVPITGQNVFDTTFTSMPYNNISAVDNNGFVSTVDYARGDQELFPSMSLRLNNGGLAFFTEQAEIGMYEYDYQAMTDEPGFNPILTGDVEVVVEQFNIGDGNPSSPNIPRLRPVVDVVVVDGNLTEGTSELDIHIELPALWMVIRAKILFLWYDGLISADNVVIDVLAKIDIVNSDLSISIRDTSVDFTNFNVEIDGFFGSIIESLIPKLIPLFVSVTESILVPLFSDFIEDIVIDNEFDIDGKTLNAMITPTYLETFESGLTVDINTSVSALNPPTDPEVEVVPPPHLGSVFKTSTVPSLGRFSPNGTEFDVGISISANLINQGLYAAHEAGITHMVLTTDDSGGTDPEGVSVIQSSGDDIQTQDIITLYLQPNSPLFINLMENDDIHGMLGWHDVGLEFELQRVGWAEPKTIFTATFDLDVGFELGATELGFLHLGIERLPIIDITDFDMPGFVPLTANFINKVIEYAMPVILPNMSARLDAVQLPTIGGYRIHADEMWVSGTGSTNFSVAGSLIEEAVAEASTAPTSSLALNTSTTLDVHTVDNGEADIEISEGTNATAEPLEYRFRVDGGGWSNWRQRTSFSLRRMMGGSHTVEVCSRTVLMKQEIACPTTQFDTAVQ